MDFASPGGEFYDVPFCFSELMTALSQCRDSSPGPDDIPHAFLRHTPDKAFSILLAAYNFIWRTDDFPSSWRVAVLLIPKHENDYIHDTSYCPISLTFWIREVLEKFINVRLMWYL